MGRAIVAFAVLTALAPTAWAGTFDPNAPTLDSYNAVFGDAVTGDNSFRSGTSSSSSTHWFVNTGADSYQDEVYERPTSQTYKSFTVGTKVGTDSELAGIATGSSLVATDTNNPAYYGYLDIVRGYAHVDTVNEIMYFAIELYDIYNYGSNGETKSDFGESSYYSIRIADAPAEANKAVSRGGLVLSAENAKDLTSTWQAKTMFGYGDTNQNAGGTGVSVTASDGDVHVDGYETDVISDGVKEGSSSPDLLYGRRITSSEGRPVVEFAFDYGTFNELFPTLAINPANLSYLLFEATRGLKGQSTYFWNDNYTAGEAGSPYYRDSDSPIGDPQNIYELDTLRGGLSITTVVPLPTAAWSALGLVPLLLLRRRRR